MDSILRQGSKGSAVAELQQLLQSKGFYTGKIDGDFGAGTTNAVLKFQKANGLVTDGIVGSSSWAKLRVVVPTTTSQGLPTLLPGSKGSAVAQAQQLLKDKGYYQGRIDGDFGMGTRDAIAAFQRANGLTVDGKVGEQTWKKLQAPAITELTPPVTFVEIIRPPAPTPVATEPSPAPIPSIFVPTPTGTSGSTTPSNPVAPSPDPATAIPTASAISLVEAANSYSRARLPNQTSALNNLQAGIAPEILQQFFQRWQIASGQATTATSLQEALSGYNSAQMLNQNLALQWLQTQLLPQSLTQFRQDWSNLNAGIGTTTTTPFTPQPSPTPSPTSQLQLINLTDAVKVYKREANQVTALENLQASIPIQTMQQFFQRWSLASEQTAIAISLIDAFQDYDGQKFPSQITALQWLEKELTIANLEQFSRDWQTI
ncbi:MULTISPECIES: peptidoglycan-binding domain-containing protein [Pseudanabaena]|jgi:peptidoglycan hydrolase-like protein with peptidoglycan-binding domain|uniref:peptidoglycan-binding domain-containing protein n=1 Tax=Pseudanabaena TaxID=1152 RepID=UPI00247AE0D1|nr:MULTISPECIES: peptidoglycan-binding protein [Pseudanabaena]MEA5486516.1 peptidoglycan-binding protein [Pseudanabaena sp. CCNP1317]WGS74201.1 peptidoglycan-binding protein [Pseudanabaena galeata CCNP1313]